MMLPGDFGDGIGVLTALGSWIEKIGSNAALLSSRVTGPIR